MISREEQQAMKELKHMISELKADTATFNHPLSRQLVHTLSVAVDCLEIALSQPERPKGRWVGIQSEKFIGYDEWGEPMYRLCSYYTCRKCGRKTVVKTNFCPNCGAEMRGEEE